MNRHRLVLLAMCWPLCASAGQPLLSLDEAVQLALKQAPQVSARAASIEAAQFGAVSAGRLPDPELVTGVDNLPIDTVDRFSLSRDFMTMRKIGVMQSFPNPEKRRLRKDRADQEIHIAEAELVSTRFDTARAVAEAWIDRAVAEQSLRSLRRLAPEIQLQSAAARSALEGGRASTAEALASQMTIERLADRIRVNEQEREIKVAELSRWIGEDARRPLADMPIDLDLGAPLSSFQTNIAEHAALAPLQARLVAAQTEVMLARAEKRLDWSLELSYARRGRPFSDMTSLEFRVGLPIFPRNRQDPNIAQSIAALRAEEADRDAVLRMHLAEVNAFEARWRHGRERLQHYTTVLLPLARDRYRASLAAYRAGRADLRSVVDALTEQTNLEIDELDLEGTVARAWAYLHLLHTTREIQ